MKKRKFKKSLLFGLAAVCLFHSSHFLIKNICAEEVDVEVVVVKNIYDVILPTSYHVAFDPYQLKSKEDTKHGLDYNSQIYTEPFLMINASDVPVLLTIYPSISINRPAKNQIEIVNSKDQVIQSQTDGKKLYMEARPISAGSITISTASAVSGEAIAKLGTKEEAVADGATTILAYSGKYLYNAPAKLNPIDSISATNTIQYVTTGYPISTKVNSGSSINGLQFMLDSAEYTNPAIASHAAAIYLDTAFNSLKGTANYAGFRLMGKLNSYASWNFDDITFNIVYTFSGLSYTEYNDAISKDKMIDKNANLLSLSAVTASSIK